MTARDYISNLRLMGAQPLEVFFQYCVDHCYEWRLRTGAGLCDALDYRQFFRECVEEAQRPESIDSTEVLPVIERSTGLEVTEGCRICNHVHLEPEKCGAWMGQGRYCTCTVVAG
jgi:hypothetical protein